MFGSIGGFEILVIAAIGLLVFGPRRLPEIARTLGKTLNEFRKTAMEVKSSIERELDVDEIKQATRSVAETIRPDSLEKELRRLADDDSSGVKPAKANPEEGGKGGGAKNT